MLKFYSTLLTFLFCTSAFAQTIKGVVSDQGNGETLISATILIKGTTTGTVTDYDGNYVLNVGINSGTLVVSYVGFETQEIPFEFADGETEKIIDIQLSEGNLLNETVVTASRFARKLGEETVSIDKISPKLIGNQNLNNVEDALGKSPGVTIVDNQANIRGGSGYSFGAGSRVLLLQDGLPITQADAGRPIWTSIPVENIGEIEIIKGAASALYGSSAMNGIVNVRTAYAKSEPETYISLGSALYDIPRDEFDEEGNVIDKKWWNRETYTYIANGDTVSKPMDAPRPYNVNVSFSHRRKMGKDDNMDFVIGGNYFGEQKWRFGEDSQRGRITGSFKHRINEKNTWGLGFGSRYERGGNFFLWNGLGAEKYIPSELAGEITDSKVTTVDASPFFNHTDDKNNSHRVKTRYLYVNNNNNNNQSNLSHYLYAEYQYQRQFPDIQLGLSAGIVSSYLFSRSELFGNQTLHGYNGAIYAQADKKFFDKLNISAGFRVETNTLSQTKAETKPVVRLGVNYQVHEATYIRASFGQGYRFPTIAEKFITTNLGDGLGILPNPDLESETGYSLEFGIKQGWQVSSKNFKGFFDASVFYMKYKNMMEFNAVREPGYVVAFSSRNVGDTFIYGMEANIFAQGKLKRFPTTLMVGYTYINPKFKIFDLTTKNGGIADYNVLKYRYRHTFTAAWDIDFKGFTFGTSWQYFSFLENLDVVFDDPTGALGIYFSQYRETRLKDGREANKQPRTFRGDFILDLRVGYHTKNNLFKLSFHVKNVANREYVLRPGLIEAPRNFSARIDIALK